MINVEDLAAHCRMGSEIIIMTIIGTNTSSSSSSSSEKSGKDLLILLLIASFLFLCYFIITLLHSRRLYLSMPNLIATVCTKPWSQVSYVLPPRSRSSPYVHSSSAAVEGPRSGIGVRRLLVMMLCHS